MDFIINDGRTKKYELKINAETLKAFKKYQKNIVKADYEKDKYSLEIIIESWIASFVDSDEYKNAEMEVKEIEAEEKSRKEREKEEREKKRIASIEKKIADLEKQLNK